MQARPEVIVEFGSGASTLVIADALNQNGTGKLFSIEHSDEYGAQTLSQLQQNHLQEWVELRISELETWDGKHLNHKNAEKPSFWYPKSLLQDIENVDLIWVDGPPGKTCLYSRYPALPALSAQLSNSVEVWMDVTVRREERYICESWAGSSRVIRIIDLKNINQGILEISYEVLSLLLFINYYFIESI